MRQVLQTFSQTTFQTSRVNHLLADLALLSIVIETSSVFVNCAIVQLFRFYYGRDKGTKYDGYVLFIDFFCSIAVALLIE